MAAGKKHKAKRLPIAKAWPALEVSDDEFAQWAETHSLEKLIGTAEHVQLSSAQPKAKAAKAGASGLRVALRMPREDLEAVRQLAREKAVSSSSLLRTWIRQRLEQEQRRVS
jgi:hypothetical protein